MGEDEEDVEVDPEVMQSMFHDQALEEKEKGERAEAGGFTDRAVEYYMMAVSLFKESGMGRSHIAELEARIAEKLEGWEMNELGFRAYVTEGQACKEMEANNYDRAGELFARSLELWEQSGICKPETKERLDERVELMKKKGARWRSFFRTKASDEEWEAERCEDGGYWKSARDHYRIAVRLWEKGGACSDKLRERLEQKAAEMQKKMDEEGDSIYEKKEEG